MSVDRRRQGKGQTPATPCGPPSSEPHSPAARPQVEEESPLPAVPGTHTLTARSAAGTAKGPPGRGRPLLSPRMTPASRRRGSVGNRALPLPGAWEPRGGRSAGACATCPQRDSQVRRGQVTAPALRPHLLLRRRRPRPLPPPGPAVPTYLGAWSPRSGARAARPGRAEPPALALRRRLRLSGKPRRCPARRPGAAPL